MKFKVFVVVALSLIVILLAGIVGGIIYAGVRVGHESKNISSKVDSFNQNVNNINSNLQKINSQLQADSQAARLP